MSEENIRQASPEQAAKNMRKQRLMLDHGINVKVDGSWGPWQQEQWEKLIPKMTQENILIKSKRIECWIGIIFILPALYGIFSIISCFIGYSDSIAKLSDLRGNWTDSEYAMSPAPLFMGLMGIAGAFLIKDSIIYIFKSKNDFENL